MIKPNDNITEKNLNNPASWKPKYLAAIIETVHNLLNVTLNVIINWWLDLSNTNFHHFNVYNLDTCPQWFVLSSIKNV